MNSITKYLGLVWIGSFFLAPSLLGQAGNNNPGGVTAEYYGSITTAGQYDPWTGNARREIDDIVVPGAIGAYPLKYTRIINTRSLPVAWTNNYTWSVAIYDPDTNNCTDFHTCGPVGRVDYPGGSSFYLEEPYTPGIWYLDANGRHGPNDTLVQCSVVANSGCEPQAVAEIRRADGGKVVFERLPSPGTLCRAYAIIDPYGQRTTLTYYDAFHYTIWKVTEPGGRYLEFIYTPALSTVQANDGRGNIMESVNYSYEQGVNHVYYDDGAVATYTYVTPNNAMPGQTPVPNLIHSCDDPRYAGPMKYIEYEYVPSTEVPDVGRGQIKAEKNILGQRVSSTTYPPAYANPTTDPNWYRRTETRGDGPSRTIYYGNSLTWTDFKNQMFTDTTTPSGWTVTDPRGNTTTYEQENALGALRKITYPQTDPNQLPATKEYTFTDPNNPYFHSGEKDENGNWTLFERYANNQVKKITYPDSSTEEFTYNGFGQVETHKLRSGGTENFRYDTRGRKIEYWPPATCDAIVCSDPYPWDHKTTYHYYESGPHTDRLYYVVDPRGNATWYQYNLRGQVTKVTHQDGYYSQSDYYADGTLAWTADENHPNASWNVAERTRYTYDQYKRVLTVTNPMGKMTENCYALDSAWYDPALRKPLLHTTNTIKYTLSPMGKNVVYAYDDNLRKTHQAVAMGTPDEAWTIFEYDEVGNLIKTTDPRSKDTTFGYDERNRKKWMIDPIATDRNTKGHTTDWEYDGVGNKTKETRADNFFQTWVYDAMNRPTHHFDERQVETIMHYDLAGNLEWNEDGNHNRYSYTYDYLNRRTVMTYPPDNSGQRRTEKYEYDWAGNLKKYTNRAGKTQTFQYDERNRQFQFNWDDGLTSSQTTTYDAASRVKQISNANATIVNTYFDDNTLASQEEWTTDNVHRTVSYLYNDDGLRSNITYPSGKDYSYDYTKRSQLWYVKDNASGIYQAAFVYDSEGNMTTRYVGNNWVVTDASQRDPLNRVTHLEHKFSGATNIKRFDYQFNKVGDRSSIQRDGGPAEAQDYDPTQQLTQTVTNGSTVTMTYDNNGNRKTTNGGGNYVSNNLNQYTVFAGIGATYDDNGNLASYNGWSYSYDAQNRLTVVRHGAAIVEQFWYDGLNRIITRNLNGNTTYHVYDAWNLIEEYAGPFAPPPTPNPYANSHTGSRAHI